MGYFDEFDEPSLDVNYGQLSPPVHVQEGRVVGSLYPPIQEGKLVQRTSFDLPESPQHKVVLVPKKQSSSNLDITEMFRFKERGIKNIPQATVVITQFFKKDKFKTPRMIEKMKGWNDVDYDFLLKRFMMKPRLFMEEDLEKDIEKLEEMQFARFSNRLKLFTQSKGGKKLKKTQKRKRKSKTKRRFMLSKVSRR